MSRVPALVVSTTTSGFGVIRALAAHGVPVIGLYYDPDDIGYASRRVTCAVQVPHPEIEETAFLEALRDLSTRYGGGVLIPTSDAALGTVSRHKRTLEANYIVACPDWPVTRRFLDKRFTYQSSTTAGVPSPRTLAVRSVADALAAGGVIGYPCLLKPCYSHRYHARFRTKMERPTDPSEMARAYRAAEAAGLEVLVQEIIPGSDGAGAVYNSYAWEGTVLAEFTAQKVRNAPPRLGSPRVSVSRHIPEVISLGRRILRHAGYSGFSCIEFKHDARDGRYKLMEVNARHNMSSILAVRCGINFPWLEYDHLVSGRPPRAQTFETGVYWIDLARDVGHSFVHWADERFPWRDYVLPYLRPHVFGDWDPGDMMPFARKLLHIGRRTAGVRHVSGGSATSIDGAAASSSAVVASQPNASGSSR